MERNNADNICEYKRFEVDFCLEDNDIRGWKMELIKIGQILKKGKIRMNFSK